MPRSIFIKPTDGYTLDGKVEAVPGLHGEVRFKYRPATPALQFDHTGTAESAARILAKQVTDVVVIDDGEETPPMRLSADQWRSVHASIWRAAWLYVMGSIGPHVEESEKNSAPPSA